VIAPPEGGLGGTSIPGDPYFLQSLAAQLGSLAVELDEVRSGLLGLESVKWDGDAAEAFKGVMRQQPSRYTDAAESFTIAAGAISAYSAVLEDAQMLTARAGDLAAEAQIATQRWEASASNTGNDPGAEGRIVAEQISLGVRADLAAASATLVATLRETEMHAPRKPSLLHEAMADAWHYSVAVPGDLAIGFGKGAWGLVDGVYQIGKLGVEATNPLMWALDPASREQADRELSEVGPEAWDHPLAFAKVMGEGIVDWNEWSRNPAEAFGELLPAVALTVATAGGGTVAKVSAVGEAAEEATAVGEASSAATEASLAAAGNSTTDVLPNRNVVDKMTNMILSGIHDGTDCSEIAEDLYVSAYRTGYILRVDPSTPELDLVVRESDRLKGYLYHQVYSDDFYIYDPRLGPHPVAIDVWRQEMLERNPGATIREVQW
jgi:hypothetical protein